MELCIHTKLQYVLFPKMWADNKKKRPLYKNKVQFISQLQKNYKMLFSPVQPARQRHWPLTGSQPSALKQSHLSAQFSPNDPSCDQSSDRDKTLCGLTMPLVRCRQAALTGHGRSHSSSLHPGEQVQLPLTGSHAASLAH